MAVTGVVLFGFVLGHMIGNLQIYLGPEVLDAYAHKLQSLGPALWGIRAVLLACVVLHIVSAIQLALLANEARPQGYLKKASVASTYASRTMLWSGPIIAAFLVYHLLHFTVGSAHPNFEFGKVYNNVVLGFQQPAVSLFYMISMVLLGFHLQHGVWSMFQTLGFNHPRYTPGLKAAATAFAVVIVVGNCSIPLAVLTGLVK